MDETSISFGSKLHVNGRKFCLSFSFLCLKFIGNFSDSGEKTGTNLRDSIDLDLRVEIYRVINLDVTPSHRLSLQYLNFSHMTALLEFFICV